MAASVKNRVVIRTPKLEDLNRLLAIENRCFRAHRFTKKDFEYHLANPSSIFAVAEYADEIKGYVAGIVYYGSRQRIARIYSMAVLRKSRKHGVGSALLKYFEHEAVKRESRSVTLEVRKTNRSARALYERFGFEVEEVLPDYYSPRSDGLRMRKRLFPGQRLSA